MGFIARGVSKGWWGKGAPVELIEELLYTILPACVDGVLQNGNERTGNFVLVVWVLQLDARMLDC